MSNRRRSKPPRRQRLGADDTLISGPMLTAAVDAILAWARLDRKHDVPYLAGYSRDAHQIALRAEQAAVKAAGVPWREYDRFMARYIKEADDVIERLPPDLDIKPYRDEHDEALLRRMQAAIRRRK